MLKIVLYAEKFELDSKIEISNGGFIFAQVNPNSYQHYGKYDYNQNLQKMIESVKKLRNMDSNINIKETPIKSSSSHISNNANKNI